jgi:arylsulfatase A-like enzyme
MSERPEQPNVLLICVDHWSGLLTGPAGHPVIMAPTIAQLAASGVNYSRAYSACPVCIPARRTLMTGQTARTHGDRVFDETLRLPSPTLAQSFRDAGYQAMAVGKLHVHPQRDRIGFDDVLTNEEGRRYSGEMSADDWELFLADQGYLGQEFAHGMNPTEHMTRTWPLPEHCHPTNWAASQMCRAMHRRDPGKPAFWYLSFIGPHPPVCPLQAYMDLYRDVEMDPPVFGDWSSSFEALPYGAKPVVDRLWRRVAPEHEQDLARRGFYASITHIDHQIRVVIGYLREQGLLENTIIGFTSDHGDMLGDHHMWAKGMMYEKSARVPLMIVPTADDDRIKPNTTDDRLVELRDIMPTLLDLCGMDCPDTVEGMSLLGTERRDHLYGEYRDAEEATRMIRDERYKLIYYPVGNSLQLFDVDDDPLEQRDLAGSPDHADAQQRLTKLLIDHLYGDDLQWTEDGQLVGLPDRVYEYPTDRWLSGQRGLRFT